MVTTGLLSWLVLEKQLTWVAQLLQGRHSPNQLIILDNFFRIVIGFGENFDISMAPPKQTQTNFTCGSGFADVVVGGSGLTVVLNLEEAPGRGSS